MWLGRGWLVRWRGRRGRWRGWLRVCLCGRVGGVVGEGRGMRKVRVGGWACGVGRGRGGGAAGGRGMRKDRVGGWACVVGRGRGGGAAEDRSDGVEGGGEEAGGGAGCLGRGRVVRGCVGGPLGATGAEAEGGAWVAAKW